MELIETAHRQDILKWRWHELGESLEPSRHADVGSLMLNAAVVSWIEEEYAFLWN